MWDKRSTETAHPTGHLDLDFSTDKFGKTHLLRRDQKFPLHFTTPLFLDEGAPDMAFVYVQNPSGAIFSGDHLRLRIAVRDGGKVHVTSTSAVKLLRMPNGTAFQLVQLNAKGGSYIEHLPDQLIPQAGSRYEQKMLIDLDQDSMLLTSEIVAPGRLFRGEIFAFKRLSFETRLRVDGREIFVDRSIMEPALISLNIRGVLGKFLYSGRIIALAPSRNWNEIWEAISSLDSTGEDFRLGVGILPGDVGVLVRVVAQSSIKISCIMNDVWSRLRTQLIGVPPPVRRK